MKRIYLLSLWLLACLVLPMKGQAVSQAELLNPEHYQHIDSTVDSGRGDGKYLDLSSIKAVDAPDGHRHVEATIYVLMPSTTSKRTFRSDDITTSIWNGTVYNSKYNLSEGLWSGL